MDGVFEVFLGGETRHLKFNNFAHVEIAKQLFGNQNKLAVSPMDVLDKMEEIAQENTMLLMKILVYAGCVGKEYEEGFTAATKQQDVGKWIAEADQESLIGIWDCFLEAMGVGSLRDLEIEMATGEEAEKKS